MINGYGIDLGTENLKIYSTQNKNIINIKNTIAIVNKNEMFSYGDDAYSMYEKAPENIDVSFPIVNGVIADFDNMQTMLLEAMEKKAKARLKGADIVVAVPTAITEVEKKAFSDIFVKAKLHARSVKVCEKPLACGIGLGLDVNEPTGIFIVDFGADTTEISVISLGGLVLTELLPYGGNKIDESIVTYMKRKFNLLIGQKTAKSLKETIGSAFTGNDKTMNVVGRDIVSGLPIEFTVESDAIYEAIKDDLESLANSVKMVLEKVPPELAMDIVHQGIYLTGGSCNLDRLGEYFAEATNITVNVAESGEETVALGLGRVLNESKFNKFGYALKARFLLER